MGRHARQSAHKADPGRGRALGAPEAHPPWPGLSPEAGLDSGAASAPDPPLASAGWVDGSGLGSFRVGGVLRLLSLGSFGLKMCFDFWVLGVFGLKVCFDFLVFSN